MCKLYTGHYGKSEVEHGLCDCTVDNPLAKARGGDYLSVQAHKSCSILHLLLLLSSLLLLLFYSSSEFKIIFTLTFTQCHQLYHLFEYV